MKSWLKDCCVNHTIGFCFYCALLIFNIGAGRYDVTTTAHYPNAPILEATHYFTSALILMPVMTGTGFAFVQLWQFLGWLLQKLAQTKTSR